MRTRMYEFNCPCGRHVVAHTTKAWCVNCGRMLVEQVGQVGQVGQRIMDENITGQQAEDDAREAAAGLAARSESVTVALVSEALVIHSVIAPVDHWDLRLLSLAATIASWSKDPSTKVGCIVSDKDHNILSTGFNGFARGVADDHRLRTRETKLKMIVHAEANAVAAAARNGHGLRCATAYVTLPPCAQCASLLMQAGVDRVVFRSGVSPSKWEAEWELAKKLMTEGQVLWVDAGV